MEHKRKRPPEGCCSAAAYRKRLRYALRNKRITCLYLSVCLTLLVLLLLVLYKITSKSHQINIYVVEEHFKVLHYWFSEVTAGRLAESGNTLIHIDAQMQMTIPTLTANYPFFQIPKDELELSAIMNSNDHFIMGAVFTGLIDHIIWIYPSWEKHLPKTHSSHKWDIGVVNDDPTNSSACACVTRINRHMRPLAETECMDSSNAHINWRLCNPKRSVYTEHIPEHEVAEAFLRNTWMRHPKSVILDVDEDFFGIESGFDLLRRGGVSWNLAKTIDVYVSDIVCAKHARHESLADVMMKDYITEIITLCHLSSLNSVCHTGPSVVQTSTDSILTNAFQEEPSMFCRSKLKETLMRSRQLVGIIKTLNIQQLKAILHLGFCLDMTFDPRPSFNLCIGTIKPNNSTNTLYIPRKSQLENNIKKYRDVVNFVLKLNPKTVSVTRSVRDGYTPRHLANDIEKAVLDHIGQVLLTRDTSYQTHFDSDLLGGVQGWNGR